MSDRSKQRGGASAVVMTLGMLIPAVVPLAAIPQAPLSAQPAQRPATKPAESKVDLAREMKKFGELFTSGKYADAIPVLNRMIAEIDRMGGGALPVQAQNYTMLGDLHRFAGNFAEAEQNLAKALAMLEKIHGAKHPDLVAPLTSLHHLRMTQGRYADAAIPLARAVAIREATTKPDDPELAWIRVTQAKLAHTLGRPDTAVTILEAALDVMRRKLPADHAYLGTTKNNLSQSLIALGRYREAEPLLDEAVRATAKLAGPTSPLHAVALNNLASLFRLQGRLLEAEELHRRELTIAEAALGPDSLDLVPSLNNLALALDALQRPREAEPLLRRALALQQTHLGPNHPDIATTTSNLATIVGHDGRRDEARTLIEQSLRQREAAFGPRSTQVAAALQNLSTVLFEDGRSAEALALAQRALSIVEGALPATHPAIGQALNNVGAALDAMGRHGEATPFLERALTRREAALGAEHPDSVLTLVNLAANALDLGQWQRAYDLAGRATELYDRALVDVDAAQTGTEAGDGALSRTRGLFLIRAVAAEKLRAAGGDAARLAAEAFQALQRDQASTTGAALRAASVRASARDPALARLVRERQDMAEQWRAQNALLLQALGKPSAERDAAGEAAIRNEALTLATLARALDTRLAREFPAYASLTRPAPLSLADVQTALGANDALVLIAPTRLGALVFAVTRTEARFVRSELKGADLATMVGRLRCGLDAALWAAEATMTACLKQVRPQRAGELPFDVTTAHALYSGLLGPVDDLIAGRHLRVVASGPLTTLPLHVLVTARPESGLEGAAALRKAAWLGRRQPIAVLPSVDSLARLAAGETAASAPRPYFAVANPLLIGPDGDDRRAFARQSCRETAPPATVAAAARSARATGTRTTRAIPRPTLDIETLRRQTPLPETADEVCAVAKLLGAGESDVLLGARASLAEIRSLAERGQLGQYRVLHFASHGFVAGGGSSLEKALPEPAILLTPPAPGTTGAKLAADSGLLSASDIAGLRLAADWVVLSACNTASGGQADAEALSGLARAFFFAGARGMLVSHWEVYSDAAVRLVTRAFEVWAAEPARGRAGALALAMGELMDNEDAFVAHPAYWAPFVVVGAR